LKLITPPSVGGRGIVFGRFDNDNDNDVYFTLATSDSGIGKYKTEFVSFFVYLSATLRENGWTMMSHESDTSLHEIFKESVE